jgi:tetratricopeptide (TPR) repeat protein
MMRARLEGNGAKRKLLWDSANSEVTYTFERIPKTSPIYAVIATNLASIRKELGRPAEAVGYATQAIEANPHNYQAYIGLALIYRSLNEPEKARDTLLAGDAAVNGESSEIHYNLGLLFFELGELDSALLYAKKAYANEYPLPGLKNKLEAAGHWSE